MTHFHDSSRTVISQPTIFREGDNGVASSLATGDWEVKNSDKNLLLTLYSPQRWELRLAQSSVKKDEAKPQRRRILIFIFRTVNSHISLSGHLWRHWWQAETHKSELFWERAMRWRAPVKSCTTLAQAIALIFRRRFDRLIYLRGRNFEGKIICCISSYVLGPLTGSLFTPILHHKKLLNHTLWGWACISTWKHFIGAWSFFCL